MIGYAKENSKIIRGNAFEQKKKKVRLKFNPGLALISLRQLAHCLSGVQRHLNV